MYRKYIKRFLDIIISLILIVILSPLIVIIGLITLIHLGLPIIDIRMKREGKNRKPFYMYKFRTRIYDNGQLWGRKTKLSSLIDNTKLNELPQLFNVLMGDMSIIGPRPFICGEELPKGKISPKRYYLRPGLIGLACINGTKCLTHKEKLQADVEYYDNISFWLDIKIFFKSIFTYVK